jgi:multidrug efflux pump subunit AcrA (membrane-fusion protein)
MSVMVTINFKNESAQTVSIPLSSVFERDGKAKVWIYNTENKTVSEQDITITQILTDGTVVVSQGLDVGDVVVTAGVYSIKEGDRVNLISLVSSTNVGGML